jgi:STE24 endopeptidase
MRLRHLALCLCLLLPFALTGCAYETPAEHAANVYAANEMAAAPLHGNLLDYSLSPEKLAKSQHLSTIHVTLHFVNTVWGVVQLCLLLWLGAIAWMRDRAVALSTNRWIQCFTFLILFLIANTLLSLPLDIYSEHLSHVYGFSVQSWAGWTGDQLKSLGLAWVFGGLVVMLLFWIIRKLPNRWWFVFWLFIMPITVFGAFLGPYVSYLFYKHEPLQKTNPALVAQLQKVVAKGHMDIPPERMYLMKASDKTTTLNADVEGFGSSKRVVVWDTTIAKATPDEITFIFGHESGHYVLGHIARGMVLGFLGSILVLYLGFVFIRWSIARFGTTWGIPSQNDWGTLVILLLALSLIGVVSEPISSTLTRQQEHAADVYGEEAIHGLVPDPQAVAKGAFDVLGDTSLADPNPSPFFEFWTYSHPAIGRRAAFGKAYNPWVPGMEPKYFKK